MKHRHRATRRRRPKYRFSKEDCRRGYQAALAKCGEDWNLSAWLFRKIRQHYLHRKEHEPWPDVPNERNEKRR